MRKVIIFIGLAGVMMAALGVYLFFKTPADVRDLDPDFELTANQLVTQYSDEEAGNKMFVGKTISVKGKIGSMEEHEGTWTLYLESDDPLVGVTCNFYPEEALSVQKLQPGNEVTVKGSCTGKIIDIVLNHCSIIQ